MRILRLQFKVLYNKDILVEDMRAMNDEELMKTITPSDGMPTDRPSAYDLLVRQSKKMGRVATSAFHGVKHILHQEIALPQAGRFLNNLPHSVQSKKERELEAAAALKKVVKKSHEVLASALQHFR